MKLRYFLLFLIFLVCSGNETVFAQAKFIEITVKQKKKDGSTEPKSNMHVFGFFDLAKGKKFERAAKDMTKVFSPRAGVDYDVYVTTDAEGFCEMQLPPTGSIVVRPEFGDPKFESLNGKLKVEIVLSYDGIQLQGTEVLHKKVRKNKPAPTRRFGNRIVFGPHSFYLFPNQTWSNARTGLAPMVKTMDLKDDTILVPIDTFMIARPFIKDGKEYQQTQKRRMGFDEKNDPLIAYRSGSFMKTREEDSVQISLVLYPVDIKKRYQITATHWFENYHNVYYSDSVCLADGFEKEPMRFLEYDLMQVPIDRTRYERQGRRELSTDKRELNLKFMVGEATLDPTDSLNILQLNQLKEDLARYLNDGESGISAVEVHGQASPDGGIAINQRLCHQRSEFLKSEIASSFPSLRSVMKASASVAGWEDVARLLEEDSLVAYANEVKDIIASNKNSQVQERKIRALPYYEMIKEKILPRLRIVEFSFTYFTRRVLTPEEIYEKFLTDPEYKTGKKEKPYEFYHLFELVKDPKELEVLAKAAWKSVKDDDFKKPWPLAAYVLSQCYLQRDTADSKLLAPYLDWDRAGLDKPELQKRGFDGSLLGWVNDEAIVSAYITHLCKEGDYYMADSVAVNLLPDEPRYFMMKRFLDCLNGLYNDPDTRDTVATTSIMNKVVLYAAQDDPDEPDNEDFHRQALLLLRTDTAHFDPEDPKVLYMIATLRFRLEANKDQKDYNESFFEKDDWFVPSEDNPFVDADGLTSQDWGYPMVQCCLKDEKYLKYVLTDGEFNKQYRTAFLKVWKKLKEKSDASGNNSNGINTDN